MSSKRLRELHQTLLAAPCREHGGMGGGEHTAPETCWPCFTRSLFPAEDIALQPAPEPAVVCGEIEQRDEPEAARRRRSLAEEAAAGLTTVVRELRAEREQIREAVVMIRHGFRGPVSSLTFMALPETLPLHLRRLREAMLSLDHLVDELGGDPEQDEPAGDAR